MAATAALTVAFIAQFGFNLAPCEMCYWQRIPYWIMIGLGGLSLLARLPERILTGIALMTAMAETGLALLHAGVEKQWWQGPTACSSTLSAKNAEELLKQIQAAPLVRCDQPAFDIFGITFAGANLLFALALTGFLLFSVRRAWARA